MDIIKALRIVVDYLDSEMMTYPNRKLADVSNYLEELHTKLGGKK